MGATFQHDYNPFRARPMMGLSVERAQELAGLLIKAHEAERDRLAHLLHDDIGQQLAGLSLALSGLRRQLADHDRAVLDASLTALQHQTMGLADSVGRLAHDIRSGLGQEGLVAALKRHGGDFQREHAIEVTVGAQELHAPMPADVALCLFRSAEEALRNVAQHAGARRIHLTLSHAHGQRTLTIADDGSGFDVASVRETSKGFGLLTIEARVRLLEGRLYIESEPGRGTTVRVVIPIVAP